MDKPSCSSQMESCLAKSTCPILEVSTIDQTDLPSNSEIFIFNQNRDTGKISVLHRSQLNLTENFYMSARNYYVRMYGFPLVAIPEQLLSSKQYQTIRLGRALEILSIFNLSTSHNHLFQHALLLDALPLPPDVMSSTNEGITEYSYFDQIITECHPPGYLYVSEVLQHLLEKSNVIKRDPLKQVALFDDLGRKSFVNLLPIYKDWLVRHHRIPAVINYTQDVQEVVLAEQGPVEAEYRAKVREIFENSYKINNSLDMTSSKRSSM